MEQSDKIYIKESIYDYFEESSQARIKANIRISRIREQFLSIEVNFKAYIEGDITVEDIEQFLSIYLNEVYNDDLGAYILNVDYRNEIVTARITDYLS